MHACCQKLRTANCQKLRIVIYRLQKRNVSYKASNDELIKFHLGEIMKIDVYIPPNNYRNRGSFISMEDFSYSRFELKDGREVYITCLMIPQLK